MVVHGLGFGSTFSLYLLSVPTDHRNASPQVTCWSQVYGPVCIYRIFFTFDTKLPTGQPIYQSIPMVPVIKTGTCVNRHHAETEYKLLIQFILFMLCFTSKKFQAICLCCVLCLKENWCFCCVTVACLQRTAFKDTCKWHAPPETWFVNKTSF